MTRLIACRSSPGNLFLIFSHDSKRDTSSILERIRLCAGVGSQISKIIFYAEFFGESVRDDLPGMSISVASKRSADLVREALNSTRGNRSCLEPCHQQASTWRLFQNSCRPIVLPNVKAAVRTVQERTGRATVLVVGSAVEVFAIRIDTLRSILTILGRPDFDKRVQNRVS